MTDEQQETPGAGGQTSGEKKGHPQSVEIVDRYGKNERVYGISYFEESPERVSVAGHFEEEVEVERDGKMKKEIRRTPAVLSVPRSAVVEVKKEYHQQPAAPLAPSV